MRMWVGLPEAGCGWAFLTLAMPDLSHALKHLLLPEGSRSSSSLATLPLPQLLLPDPATT